MRGVKKLLMVWNKKFQFVEEKYNKNTMNMGVDASLRSVLLVKNSVA